MSEVKRHTVHGYGRQDIYYNEPDGEFVFYEEYAELKAQHDELQEKLDLKQNLTEQIVELKKQRDALAAENAVLKDGAEYFMYGPDCGLEIYDNQDEAVKAANEMIDSYREDAGDGWCDEVEQVCFGIVISYSRQHDVQQPSEDNGFLGSVDYMMSAPEGQATDAWLKSRDEK